MEGCIQTALKIIEKVGDVNTVTQQCKNYFFSLQGIAENPGYRGTHCKTTFTQPSIPDPRSLGVDVSFEQNTVAGVFTGDWSDVYGAADIFKDPLLPDFGLNWGEF